MSHRQLALALSLLSLSCSACDDAANAHDSATDSDTRADGGSEQGEPERDAGTRADGGTTPERDASVTSMDGGGTPSDASAPSDAGRDAGRDAASGADAAQPAPLHTFVYVGCYRDSDGLRAYEIDRTSLALTPIAQDAAVGPNPSYLTPSADGRTLYAANESDGNGGITVLRLNPSTGVPSRVDHEDAISAGYVFSSPSPDGKYLLAASYNGGNVGVYPIKGDGTLDPRVDAREFGGGAQAHSVRVHVSGKWAYVPNKGLDSLAQLKFDAATGKLSDNTPATFAAQPSASNFDGPRHIAFSRDGELAFVILELGNALFSLDVQDDGTLRELDREPREAESAGGSHTGAHVLAHPTANFVYGSNRVSNTLVAFSYDAQGKLSLIGRVSTRGSTPRNFDIDPLGKFLIVANQDSGSLAVFSIESDGRLSARGNLVTGLDSPAGVAIVVH